MGALVINGQKVAGVNIEIKPEIYSTEEREVGVWTDGKPLYQKTVEINNIAFDNDWHDVAHGVSNIDKVISCVGIMFGADGEFFNIPQYRANTSQGITFGIQGSSSEYIGYINNWYDGASKIYATIQYTKTTDQAGAGTWTPDGAYAHHYSTDEKVVGTWIDGSTLYEKTYDLGQDVAIKYNEWTEVNATKPNGILKYINIFGTQDDGTGVVLTGANPANTTYSNIRLSTRRFQDESVRWFTIQYTKSS